MSKLKVGLQMWSLHNDMERDMEGAFRAAKEMGYDYVECGEYFGWTAEAFAALLEKYDLKCISVHHDYKDILAHPEKTLAFFKIIGTKYCTIPWMPLGNHKGHENFETAIKEITQVAELLKENGIRMLYHNHDFEFNKYEEKFLLDWLYETIPAELIQPELDTCWVHYAGYDPAEYLRKYAGRIEVVHLKDYVSRERAQGPVYDLMGVSDDQASKRNKERIGFGFRPLGQGVQDFSAILKAAEESGTEYVIVEQDESLTMSPLEAAKQSREYLRKLGL